MARPPLPLGAHGEIHARETANGWFAECYYRGYDGRTRRVQRRGNTEARAKRILKAAIAGMVEAGHTSGSPGLKPHSRVREAAELWLKSITADRASTTIAAYRCRLNSLVLPTIGDLLLREVDAATLDALMYALRERGLAPYTLSTARCVLGGIFGYATKHRAIRFNPVRDMSSLDRTSHKAVRALTPAERAELLAGLDADPVAVHRDLPDLVRFMLATGMRLGEAIGVRWCDVDLERKLVRVTGNIVSVPGRGLVRRGGKTAAALRTIPLAQFVVTRLKARLAAYAPGEVEPRSPVFPNTLGAWQDPSWVTRVIREYRTAHDCPWLTSHIFRKTAATILKEQGWDALQIANFLGHTKVSLTQDVYLGRDDPDPAMGEALDRALGTEDDTEDGEDDPEDEGGIVVGVA